MATVELQYDAWDNTEESIVEQGLSLSGQPVPFDPIVALSLMMQEEHFYHTRKSGEYREAVRQMTANLWHTLAWFRRLELPGDQLKTLINDYRTTSVGEKAKFFNNDALRDAMDDGKDAVIEVPSLARLVQ